MRHPRSLLALVLVAVIGLLAAGPATAFAHTPVLERSGSSDAPWKAPEGYGPAQLFPGAQDLPDPRISRAVYGTLAAGELFDAYRLEIPPTGDATAIPVELLIPASAANAAFRPSVAIIGAGETTPSVSLPGPVLEHLRAVQTTVAVTVAKDPGADPRASEYEPFVGETLWRGASTTVTVEPGETYYVLVYDPAGATGEYRLVLGKAEGFTPGEALSTPGAILRIKLGLYGQDSFQWGFAAVLATVVALVVALAVWLVRRRRRRRARG
jgi:hypothetical protein